MAGKKSGGDYLDIHDGGPYSNTTTATLTITDATESMNDKSYHCRISNACTTTDLISAAATLTVNSGFTITSQPTDAKVCPGGNTSFSVSTTGETATYQWQVDEGTGYSNITNNSVYSNATTSTLSITGVTSSITGYKYRAALSSSSCPVPQYSSSGTLLPADPIRIVSETMHGSVCENENAFFTISATGKDLQYQWQANPGSGFANISDNTTYAGATGNTLTVNNAGLSLNGYRYRSVITDACGQIQTTSHNSLTVDTKAEVILQPTSKTVPENTSVSFSLSATGTNIVYQWQYDTGNGFENLSEGGTYENVNTPVLTIPKVIAYMNGYKFRCLITNSCPEVTSEEAILTVTPPLPQPAICMVTVDDATGKNMVVFEKPVNKSQIDSFRVYKEGSVTNQFRLIGRVGKNEFSTFTDLASSPTEHADVYKISMKDIYGNETPLSAPHKTMHLTISQGMNKSWNLIWNQYQGTIVNTYNVYRGTSASNMSLLISLSGSNSSFTDYAPPMAANILYQIEIVGTTCDPSAKTTAISFIRSNIAETKDVISGISQPSADPFIRLYPNPARDMVSIEGQETEHTVRLYDMAGKVVRNYESPSGEINIKGLEAGIYMVEIMTGQASVRKLLLVE